MNIDHVAIPIRGWAMEVMDSLEDGKASSFDIPSGKTETCVRSALSAASKRKGIKLSVSFKDGRAFVWRRDAARAGAA